MRQKVPLSGYRQNDRCANQQFTPFNYLLTRCCTVLAFIIPLSRSSVAEVPLISTSEPGGVLGVASALSAFHVSLSSFSSPRDSHSGVQHLLCSILTSTVSTPTRRRRSAKKCHISCSSVCSCSKRPIGYNTTLVIRADNICSTNNSVNSR